MDRNGILGAIKGIKGEAKVAIAKLVGDAKLQSDGKVEVALGKAQNAVGGASESIRAVAKPT